MSRALNLCAIFAESVRVCVRVCACVRADSLPTPPPVVSLLTVWSASVDKMYMLHYKLVQFSAWNLCTESICMDNMHTTYLYKCI